MKRFKSILFCPLSNDVDAALRRSVDLAIANDARLTLFGAVPEASLADRLFGRGNTFDAVAAATEEVQEKLDRLADQADQVTAETVIGSGNYAIGAVQQTLAMGHDLVIVTPSEGREDSATINRLLRKSPCPVWVVRSRHTRIRRVLAAVNPVPDETELNRLVLEIASSLAATHGGELYVAHAWELFAEHLMRSPQYGGYSEAELEARRSAEQEYRYRDLSGLLDACESSIDPIVRLEHGPPAQVIVDLVRDEEVDVLVMGTVARTGVTGFLMGNTAERILNEVSCSILAVKPPGFVSPVAPLASEPHGH